MTSDDARNRMIARMLNLTESEEYGNMHMDSLWSPGEHPRRRNGQFAPKGEGGGGSAPTNSGAVKANPKSNSAKGTQNNSSTLSHESSKNPPREQNPTRHYSLKVNGPKKTEKFIRQYAKKHPEVIEEGRKLNFVLNKIKRFNRTHDPEDEGTFSAITGERINSDTGYWVTFHQNQSLEMPYKAYNSQIYGIMCAIAMRETGSKDVYIGFFGGNAEVSFYCEDSERAMKFASEQNQHSYYDVEQDLPIKTKTYNKATNPLRN